MSLPVIRREACKAPAAPMDNMLALLESQDRRISRERQSTIAAFQDMIESFRDSLETGSDRQTRLEERVAALGASLEGSERLRAAENRQLREFVREQGRVLKMHMQHLAEENQKRSDTLFLEERDTTVLQQFYDRIMGLDATSLLKRDLLWQTQPRLKSGELVAPVYRDVFGRGHAGEKCRRGQHLQNKLEGLRTLVNARNTRSIDLMLSRDRQKNDTSMLESLRDALKQRPEVQQQIVITELISAECQKFLENTLIPLIEARKDRWS